MTRFDRTLFGPTSVLALVCLSGFALSSTSLGCGSPSARAEVSDHINELEDQYRNAPVVRAITGRASYYSDRLAGRSTASGEPYRPALYTAASRDLPFGTIVRVRRLDGERQVTYVRVNDRGPFGDRTRILDLSRIAAEQLDMIRNGVVRIRAEIVHLPE